MQRRTYKCGANFDTHMGAGALAVTIFLFQFPLFSNTLLPLSHKMLWERGVSKFKRGPCSAKQSKHS